MVKKHFSRMIRSQRPSLIRSFCTFMFMFYVFTYINQKTSSSI